MKRPINIKKLILLNLPYILAGLFATNFGEAWRLAQGADASEKFLSLLSVLPEALGSWWPSLHPLDLLVGLCCGTGLRLAVYLKGKNAKKYRHNVEYGSSAALPVLSFFSGSSSKVSQILTQLHPSGRAGSAKSCSSQCML